MRPREFVVPLWRRREFIGLLGASRVTCRATRATAGPNTVAHIRMHHEECKHTASIMTPLRTLLANFAESSMDA
jgi:hypothetical protein